MRIHYETISFRKRGEDVSGLLLKYFQFTIRGEDLDEIGPWEVVDGGIEIEAHEKKRRRFEHVLSQAMQEMTCTITRRPARYIDEYSGVPLIGCLEFGIIDRGTNIIEIRPCSGCNLACTYCSVSEGPEGPKIKEFVIQPKYLLDEFDKLASIKEHDIEVFIETQGEPLLYDELPYVIKRLKERGDVKQVTMVTNGTFLTEDKIDELAAAGLDRINWSINSLREDRAREIAGRAYGLSRIKKLIDYAKDHIDVLMCPVIMRGVNEDELEDFVKYGLQVRKQEPVVGFQNFLWYKGGRNPVKEIPMPEFEEEIKRLEKKYDTKLLLSEKDFTIEYDNAPKRPFRKKETIEVERLFPGRQKNETLCKAQGRTIKVIGRVPNKERFNVQIIRDKHNIYYAKAL